MGLRDQYAALLLDLDGTLYRGGTVIAGGPEALRAGSERLVYVTNNASRSAAAVGRHLVDMGYPAGAEAVVTSAQAAARILAEKVGVGAQVLVVGTDDLAAEVAAVGLRPIRRFTDIVPAAVVQGHSPRTGWADLAEAAYALRADAVWVAANTDTTLPNERGLAPGNGAMVAALVAALQREPLVAGKPYAPLLEDALRTSGTRAALVVGDRLDTDINGAATVGLDSLMVLTGVHGIADLRTRQGFSFPTYVANGLDALNHPPRPGLISDLDEIVATLRAYPEQAVRVRASQSEIR